jgi:hypothetical protein
MDFVYIKLENIKYAGKRVYYQSPIDTSIHKANVFSQHYEYFYKEDHDIEYRSLGGFRDFGNSRSCSHAYYDFDYIIYFFDGGSVEETKREYIYCRGIPEDCVHLELVKNMTYLEYPVFVSTR